MTAPIRELHVEWTRRCDMRCLMCHHWRLPPGREMTVAELASAVGGSRLLSRVETVVLTGGEPWLRGDLPDLARFLAGSFPKASIGFLSNLWDAARIASGLRSLRPLGLHRFWLGSSLDGVGRAHDAVRGKRGAFERTVRGARALRREFPGLGLSFNFTITPGNADEIWPAYRLASGMGLWFGAQMAVNHAGIRGAPRFSWSGGEIEAARRQIDLVVSDLSLREDPLGGRVKFWTYLKEYLLRPRRFFGDCLAGERYAMIDPQGRLFFCPVRKHRTVGSILGGFDAAWSSEKAQAERASIARRRCHCWLHCTANPLLAGLRP